MASFCQKGIDLVIHRRHQLALAILLALSLVLGACGNSGKRMLVRPTGTAASGFVVLAPLTAGRDLSAPDGWYTVRIPADWVESPPIVAELSARSTTGADPVSLRITRESLDTITTAQAYLEATRRDINTRYENVVTISLGPVRAGNVDAIRWLYRATVDGKPRLIYQLFVVQEGTGLVLTGVAPGDADFHQVGATFDAIAGTLSFGRG
ncbi:MAG TPA: hypothetical protein DCX80_02380 [Chloroflexi bacterium]|nr:hypothetical protein [Chloroflexota bacterium]HBY45742.1 hypothetical protein [Chloroflexota bacterium]